MSQIETQQSVLVVEDEAFIRMSTVASLEDAGLNVLEAGEQRGSHVIFWPQHAEISVMVTDVRMPGAMDGLALVSRVCRDHPLIRAIVVSGNTAGDEAYKAGAAKFMPKPYRRPIWWMPSSAFFRATRRRWVSPPDFIDLFGAYSLTQAKSRVLLCYRVGMGLASPDLRKI